MKDFADEVEDVFESIGMEELFMFFAILFGIMIIALIVAAVAKRNRDAANAACPVNRMHARVVDKQQLSTNGIVVYSQIWVLFELDDGRRVRLTMSGNNSVVVGDSGNLTWQGDAMISFTRDGTPGMGRSIAVGQFSAQQLAEVGTTFNQDHIPAWKRVEMEMEAAAKKDKENEQSGAGN